MRFAVLMAPGAGEGKAARAAKTAAAWLRGHELASVPGWGAEVFGGEACVPALTGSYLGDLAAAVDALEAGKPDCYVLVGGDGLCAYVADRLVTRGRPQPRLVGIAGGTANVGPIIALRAEELAGIDADSLRFEPCDGLEARDASGHLAYGFNDLVLGNTLLATCEGQMATVSARVLALEGLKKREEPLARIAEKLTVLKNGEPVPGGIPSPAQAVASCLNRDRTYGRAVMGALCFSAGEAHAAGLALLSDPVISLGETAAGYRRFLSASQLIFMPEDELAVSGFGPESCLIADGNPYLIAGPELTIRIKTDLIRVLKRRETV